MQPSQRQYSCVPSKMGRVLLLDKLVALGGAHAQRIAAALQCQKELGAVIVFPCAGVHRAAAQADEDRQVLDAHGALELACTAGGALECRLLRVVFAEQRFLRCRAIFVEIAAQTEDDFFRVQELAGVVGGAMLGAAPALHAGVGLQAREAREILAGDEAEVFVAAERGNAAESAAREKDGERAQNQVQMLGMGNDGQKGEQRERVRPPERAGCETVGLHEKCGQIGDHQQKDQQGDEAGFP